MCKRHNINTMKLLNPIIYACILVFLLNACSSNSAQKVDEKLDDLSIYHLKGSWHNQNNDSLELSSLKGKVLVMVMIYTTCQAACPRLVADMRDIESKIPKNQLDKINFVLVSIDPINDTPERLKVFAKDNFMEASHWTFLQGNTASVQEFANVLAVKYKKISPMDFSHSNIISVFNPAGVLVHQQEGLGVNNNETVETIIKELKK